EILLPHVYAKINDQNIETALPIIQCALQHVQILKKQYELTQELAFSNHYYEEFFNASNCPVATLKDGIFTEANINFMKSFGFNNNQEIIGLSLIDVLQPLDLFDVKKNYQLLYSEKLNTSELLINSDTLGLPLHCKFLKKMDTVTLIITNLNAHNYPYISTKEMPSIPEVKAIENQTTIINNNQELDINDLNIQTDIDSYSVITSNQIIEDKTNINKTSNSTYEYHIIEDINAISAYNNFTSDQDIIKTLDNPNLFNHYSLQYQKIYDKNEIDLAFFEVSTGIQSNQNWINLNNSSNVTLQSDLSNKLDLKILSDVLQLYKTTVTQVPNLKFLVNLNHYFWLDDYKEVQSMLNKIRSISHRSSPSLILQFPTQPLHQHPEYIEKLQELWEQGLTISLRNFQLNDKDFILLSQLKFDICRLDKQVGPQLEDQSKLLQVQNALQSFKVLHPAEMILPELDDINSFANAWNVDIRYVQGDYFQKKTNRLIFNAE
ncbi:MAG: EAL domain-containing protein, partial [Acinetobacter sp.]